MDKKKRSTQKDIENINMGKKTVTTLFKNSDDVGSMTSKVEGAERDLETTSSLYDVMTVYIATKVLPEFKAEKQKLYHRIL